MNKILLIGRDDRNIFENDFSELLLKMKRDRLDIYNDEFFIIDLSNKSYYKKNNNIETIHIKSIFGHIRILNDIVLFFIVPMILKNKKFKPDYLILRDFPLIFSGLLTKLLYKTKIVFFLGTMPRDLANSRNLGLLKKYYYVICEFLYKIFIDIYIANGNATKQYLINLGIKEDKINIMTENIIQRDEEFIKKSQGGLIKQKHNIENKKIILSVGRLEQEKNFDKLIDIFSKIKKSDYVLIIAGDGSLKRDLIKKVKELNIENQVIFVGVVNREEIWNYYNDADLFILFSKSEGNPTVLREAMYMNVPVIGSDISPIIEFIGKNNERGFIWNESQGINDLENKINFCLNSSVELEEMKLRAKQFIENNLNNNLLINNFLDFK